MDQRPPPDDPLVAFLSGKRRSPRFRSSHRVLVKGVGAELAGRAVDTALGGVRILMEDPAFYQEGETGLALVERAFPAGIQIFFPQTGTAHDAEIVRILSEDDGSVILGCRFVEALETHVARTLGIPAVSFDEAAAPGATLPQVPRRGVSLSMLIFGAGEPVTGPLYVGRVAGVGDVMLDVTVPGPDGTEERIAADLGRKPFCAALVRGRRRLWEGKARLLRVSLREGEITLRVVVEEQIERALRRSVYAAPPRAVQRRVG